MDSLKQEMRQFFDSRNGFYSDEADPLQEEGLLEKITNLAFLNLYLYDNHIWNILAIRSKVNLQKLYRLLKDPVIPVSSVALLISNSAETPYKELHSKDLLSMSLMYAAKYYYVDFHIVQEFDNASIVREFSIPSGKRISSVLCLGHFGTGACPLFLEGKSVYSDIVIEM